MTLVIHGCLFTDRQYRHFVHQREMLEINHNNVLAKR